MAKERAIGIVRVSQRRGSDSEHSPEVQVRAMLKHADERGYELRAEDIWDENLDTNGNVRKVSGSWGLQDRAKLRAAVEAVEQGTHKVILAERFDRLFRPDHNENASVQREVVRRVEAVGGKLEAVRGSAISYATAESGLQADINEAVSRYTRRTAMERSWDAVEVAIEEGKIPWSQTPPGYHRSKDSKLTPDRKVAPVITKAFKMRAKRKTIRKIREYLRTQGIERTYHGVQHLLRDRTYLGEIHFGTHTPNRQAHDAIIDRELFKRVQEVRDSRGRRAKSDRLLARLGVLTCGSCGSRMVVGTQTQNGRSYPFYRCPPTGDCTNRMAIGATIVEDKVIRDLAVQLAGLRGAASEAFGAEEAKGDLQAAQAALDQAIRVLSGLEDEPAAIERLAALRRARDDARDRYEELAGREEAMCEFVTVGRWEELDRTEKRSLIQAVIKRVVVRKGRGEARISIEWATDV
jgi:hypothetical protein